MKKMINNKFYKRNIKIIQKKNIYMKKIIQKLKFKNIQIYNQNM